MEKMEKMDKIDAKLLVTDLDYQKERAKKSQFCNVHPREEIRAFCKNDFTAICFRCYLEVHKNHDVVMLEDINSNDLRDKITEFELELGNQSNKIYKLGEVIGGSKQNYDSQFVILKQAFTDIQNMCLKYESINH